MRVVIGGYVPEEGRVSILRTAHSIARHVAPLLDARDAIVLANRDEGGDGGHVRAAVPGWRVKLEKRLLGPARLWWCGADVIHVIDNDHAFGIAPWNYRRTVVTCHDLMPFLLDPSLKSVFRTPAGRSIYRRTIRNMEKCAHVACVSEFTRGKLLELSRCNPDRTSVIPQAVEAHFRPMEKDDPALSDFAERHGLSGKRVVLHVGSCLPYKNIAGLLEIFRRLAADDGELTLLKVGGAFSQADLGFIETHGLRPRLVHLRGLSEGDLVLAYNASALLLWPSHFEGFGLPVLEAMACGIPVVCSNGGALPEVAAGVARVHGPGDMDGMAASCREILGDSGLAAALGAAGIAHAGVYTWRRAAEAYCAVYGGVAGAG